MTTTTIPTDPPDRRRRRTGRADPHLLSGRGTLFLLVSIGMVLCVTFADSFAFKAAVDVLLRLPEWQSWVIALGAALGAVVIAIHFGTEHASLRAGDHDASMLHVIGTGAAWVGLGAALWYVRWTSPESRGGSGGGFSSGPTPQQAVHQAHASAFFFLALYLASGWGAAVIAAKLSNPAYQAYHRAEALYVKAAATYARAKGMVERATSAVTLHSGEFDRESSRRDAAIAERKALGAEAANYARVLIAQLKKDPRITDITETGPVIDQPRDDDDTTGGQGQAA